MTEAGSRGTGKTRLCLLGCNMKFDGKSQERYVNSHSSGGRGGSEDCSSRVPVSNTLSNGRTQIHHGWQEESDAATTKVYT
jgi:hypothetical protein